MLFDLEQAGVPTYAYPWYSAHCPDESRYCYSSQDYRHELLRRASDSFILDLTFLRTLPNSLRALLIGSVGRERPAPDS